MLWSFLSPLSMLVHLQLRSMLQEAVLLAAAVSYAVSFADADDAKLLLLLILLLLLLLLTIPVDVTV